MRIYRSVLAAIGGVVVLGAGTVANAGSYCSDLAGGPSSDCAPGVVVHGGTVPTVDPMVVNVGGPFGHLRSVNYSGTPSMNVTRIYGQGQMPHLSDSPSGFTGGCHPTTTSYCSANTQRPVQVELNAPVYSAPVHSAPVYNAPVYSAPVVAAPTVTYDSRYESRQYGSIEHVPGIAHIPTSIVDRSEANRDAILASGRTVTQPVVSAQSTYSSYQPSYSSYQSAPVMSAPVMQAPVMQAPVMQAPVTRGIPASGPAYTAPAADGTYWEKVSGMTAFGDTVATQVICKKAMPRRVVRPVVGVPVPVHVPAPTCAPGHGHDMYRYEGRSNSRYGDVAPHGWTR